MLPFIVGAGVISLGVGIYKSLSENDTPSPSYSYARCSYYWCSLETIIIGPTGAGKSTLAEILCANTEQKYEHGIGVRVGYPPSTAKVNSCKSREEYVQTEWQETVKGKEKKKGAEICLYVFNLKDYVNNIKYEDYTYQQIVLLHLDLVYDWIQHSNQANQKFIVIGTHLDELENDSDADSILNEIKSKLKNRKKEGVSFKALSLTSIDDNTVSDLDKLIRETPNAKDNKMVSDLDKLLSEVFDAKK